MKESDLFDTCRQGVDVPQSFSESVSYANFFDVEFVHFSVMSDWTLASYLKPIACILSKTFAMG
jgi:hypothetical protein